MKKMNMNMKMKMKMKMKMEMKKMKEMNVKMKMEMEMEHLSGLPDELVIIILSLLPTLMAVRTSVLSRRFRHLWKASPSAELLFSGSLNKSTYVAMAKSLLLMTHLLRLDLDFDSHFSGDQSFIFSLPWPKGLRHLTIYGRGYWKFGSILRSIFSSCISLSLSSRFQFTFHL
ncbi:F-box/LRR-repeat protein 13 [Carex littledalei]|uniref:F-box/LRR-repeat protein 13 n=1 Tax=Carex littledalei TaxID=544730 RepID=A0A833V7R2_9POAL|nr:F-box/LRR-repeat protein 13 [Carex littledalei]